MKKLLILLCLGLSLSISTVGQLIVAAGFENDYIWRERFKRTMAKASVGVAKAQYSVGEMLEKGRGVAKNTEEAFRWYEKAAKQHNTKALFKMGYLYYKGSGVEKDAHQAFQYLEESANQGHIRAQYYLGKLYENGVGTKQNQEKALLWYNRASLAGYKPAENSLNKLKKIVSDKEASDINNQQALTPQPTQPSRNNTVATITPNNKGRNAEPVTVTPIKVRPPTLNPVTQNILNSHWTGKRNPAEFLPSSITNCKKTSNSIMECLSGKLRRNIGPADITYISNAMLFEIEKNGEFKVVYRNNVLEINPHEATPADEEEGEGESTPAPITVEKGWQETEHQLECKLENQESIVCIKGKVRKLTFTRQSKR